MDDDVLYTYARAVDQRGDTIDFYLSSRRNTKSAYCFLGKILNNVKKWQIPQVINTDKAPTYRHALSRRKTERWMCHQTLSTGRLSIKIM